MKSKKYYEMSLEVGLVLGISIGFLVGGLFAIWKF